MYQDPEVAPTGQGTRNTHHQRVIGAHFRPEEGPLQAEPPEVRVIPILVQLLMIADGTPEGKYIAVAVRRIQTGRTGGPSGMRVENLKVYLR